MSVGPTGTGNLEALVQQLLTLERRPLDNLNVRRNELQSIGTALSGLSSKLSSLRTQAQALNGFASLSPLYQFQALSSDENSVGATAGPGALAGSFTVDVNSLAAAHAEASQTYTFTGTSFSAGSYEFDITVAGETHRIAVTVDAADDNKAVLAKVAAALNTSDAKVIASVPTTNDTTGEGLLVVRSRDSGTANAITSINDVTGTLATQLSFTTSQTAADADLVVDGVQITSSSNTVEGAIPGVTLTVKDVTVAGVSIEISGDSAGVQSAIEEFIDAYNQTISEVRVQVGSTLKGQTVIASLTREMTRAVSRAVTGLDVGDPRTLLELGISIGSDGALSISNATRLEEVIEQKGLQAVAVIFNDPTDGIAGRLESLLDSFLGSGGIIGLSERANQSRLDRVDTRIEAAERRLEQREVLIRRQMAQLQELVSNLAAQRNIAAAISQGLI